MRVSEAVKNWSTVLGQEVEIEGVAEISHTMSVIYQDRDKKEIGAPITPGVLIHGDQLKILVESLPNLPAAYVGSEVLYVVKVRVLGIVANTGYSFAPLKFGHIYEIEFDDEYAGLQRLAVNARLKDIVFKINRSLEAQEVKKLTKYFPDFKKMIELKRHLESGAPIALVSRVLESEISEHINLLQSLNIEYEVNNSPIENGFWGMP